MNGRVRRAGILTFVFAYGALWIAFVMAGDRSAEADWPLRWLPPAVAVILLVGTLFLAGLMAMPDAEMRRQTGSSPVSPIARQAVAAVLMVGAVLGLVSALEALLWGGPDWLRWTIVGLAIVTVIAGSGRAIGCAALGGLLWGAVAMAISANREPTDKIDLILTALLVGVTIGAVGGTILRGSRQPKRPGGP
jgi:hypothetical protein